jgi:branched-chain amino acid transport system substrate-binding protein
MSERTPVDRAWRRSRRRRWLAVLLPVAAISLLASCSSSSSTSTGSPAATAGATGQAAATSASWVLGNIGTYSGPTGNADYAKGIEAWQDWTNSRGGIDGHTVKVIVMDDQGSPSVALSDLRELTQQDHVLALVGDYDSQAASYASAVAAAGVPVIGGDTEYPIYNTNPDFFTTGMSTQAEEYTEFEAAKKIGAHAVGVLYCVTVAACAQANATVKADSHLTGIPVPYFAGISSSAPSYTAECLGARGVGANVLDVEALIPTIIRIGSDCAQQGFHPMFLGGGNGITNAWLSSAMLNGAVVAVPTFPFTDASTAAAREFQQAMTEYFPNESSTQQFGAGDASEWTGGQLFAAAAQAAHLGDDPTPAQVKTGLYDLHDETLGGLVGPLTFTPGKPTPGLCAFVMQVEGQKWTEPNGPAPICMTPADYSQLAAS